MNKKYTFISLCIAFIVSSQALAAHWTDFFTFFRPKRPTSASEFTTPKQKKQLEKHRSRGKELVQLIHQIKDENSNEVAESIYQNMKTQQNIMDAMTAPSFKVFKDGKPVTLPKTDDEKHFQEVVRKIRTLQQADPNYSSGYKVFPRQKKYDPKISKSFPGKGNRIFENPTIPTSRLERVDPSRVKAHVTAQRCINYINNLKK
jgi:hypothetical protein